MEMANPSDDIALIIPLRLPMPLETLRQRTAPDAGFGLPAHVTLLHPFASPEALDGNLRANLGAIVSGHAAFSFRLADQGQWPGTLFASVEPDLPFRSLYEDLLTAFPAFPIHRGKFDFVPHVTIAEGPFANAPEVINDPAWECLPTTLIVGFADLIVREADGWETKWRFDFNVGPENP